MARIDSHQHFWNYDPGKDTWMTDEMSLIRRDFTPQELQPILDQNGFDGCVLIQVDQTEKETELLLELSDENDFIQGVVGWINMQSAEIEGRLAYYTQFSKLKGFRHILQGEAQRDFMLRSRFKRGIGLLNDFGFTFDILIYPDQLQYSREFVHEFPNQKFVIDHLAKPYIKDKKIDQWREDMLCISRYENVFCKISGFVTEADWKGWKKEDFTPYFDCVVEAFGTGRIMFGSDWPVCKLASDYKVVVDIAEDYFSSFTRFEQDQIFGRNAIEFYNL